MTQNKEIKSQIRSIERQIWTLENQKREILKKGKYKYILVMEFDMRERLNLQAKKERRHISDVVREAITYYLDRNE